MTTNNIYNIGAVSFKSLPSLSNIIGILFVKTSVPSFTSDVQKCKNTLNSNYFSYNANLIRKKYEVVSVSNKYNRTLNTHVVTNNAKRSKFV